MREKDNLGSFFVKWMADNKDHGWTKIGLQSELLVTALKFGYTSV